MFVRDPDGCLRLRPAMTYYSLPLQDQADTVTDWTGGFVTGDIIDATGPVCGVTRIFHLLSRQ